MQIFVKRANMTDVKTIVLEVDPSDLVNDVKDKIEKKVNIPIGQQKLYYNCERLDDYKTLTFYNMSKNSTLQLFGSSKGPPIQTKKGDTEKHQDTGGKLALSSWERNGCSSERLDNLNIKMTSFGDVRKQEEVEKIVKEKGKKEAMKQMEEVLENFKIIKTNYVKTSDRAEHIEVELKHVEAKYEKILDQAEHVQAEHLKANIEHVKSDNEKELLKVLPLQVMALNRLMQKVSQDRLSNTQIEPIKLHAKKTSRKSRMLKKLHDRNVNFKSKKLHEVFKMTLERLTNLHIHKGRFLNKEAEEANSLKKENGETMEHFEIKCKNIQSELTENKRAHDLEIKDIISLEEQWIQVRSWEDYEWFFSYLDELQELIYCQETVMIEKYKCEADKLNPIEAAHDNSSEKAAIKKKNKFLKCCWFCSEEEGILLKCSGCKKAYYCNDKCIQKDWHVHGDWCNRRRIKREEREGKK